jgi:hypothetical protein
MALAGLPARSTRLLRRWARRTSSSLRQGRWLLMRPEEQADRRQKLIRSAVGQDSSAQATPPPAAVSSTSDKTWIERQRQQLPAYITSGSTVTRMAAPTSCRVGEAPAVSTRTST